MLPSKASITPRILLLFTDIRSPGSSKSFRNKSKEHVVLDDAAKGLARHFIEDGAISGRHLVDAQHIAMAAVNRIDVLVSWNFKHIVNLIRIRLYNSVDLKYGRPLLEIRSPREVIDERKGI